MYQLSESLKIVLTHGEMVALRQSAARNFRRTQDEARALILQGLTEQKNPVIATLPEPATTGFEKTTT